MKQRRLLYIDSVEVHFTFLQAFQFFLGVIWQDVEIVDIQSKNDDHYSIDLSMPETIKGELIMCMWEDWKANLMHEMYAVRN